MKNNSDVPAPEQQRAVAPQSVASPSRRRNGLALLALSAAVAAVAIQFHPLILGQLRQVLGPQPWISTIEGALSPRPALGAAATAEFSGNGDEAVAAALAELETLRTETADLKAAVAQLEQGAALVVRPEDLAALQSKLDAQAQAGVALNEQMAQQLRQVAADLATVEQRLSVAQPSHLASLLVARMALVNSTRTLTAEEVEQLASVAAVDPALSEVVATLKVLAGQPIYSFAALRERFAAEHEAALEYARGAQLQWWESGLSSAHSTMANWGLTRPVEESKDDLVVAEAMRLLDLNNLRGALFQLDSASPELKEALAQWRDQAQLRQTFDDTLLQLVDILISRDVRQQIKPTSDG